MRVILATDGSKESLSSARYLMKLASPDTVEEVIVVAVTRPLAAVGFAEEISASAKQAQTFESLEFHKAAERAVAAVAEILEGWGPKVRTSVRSGSPANEIVKAAKQLSAQLVVVANGSRGLSSTVLMGSTAQRVQQYAPCPVLVVRPAPRPKAQRTRRQRTRKS